MVWFDFSRTQTKPSKFKSKLLDQTRKPNESILTQFGSINYSFTPFMIAWISTNNLLLIVCFWKDLFSAPKITHPQQRSPPYHGLLKLNFNLMEVRCMSLGGAGVLCSGIEMATPCWWGATKVRGSSMRGRRSKGMPFWHSSYDWSRTLWSDGWSGLSLVDSEVEIQRLDSQDNFIGLQVYDILAFVRNLNFLSWFYIKRE